MSWHDWKQLSGAWASINDQLRRGLSARRDIVLKAVRKTRLIDIKIPNPVRESQQCERLPQVENQNATRGQTVAGVPYTRMLSCQSGEGCQRIVDKNGKGRAAVLFLDQTIVLAIVRHEAKCVPPARQTK